MLGNALCDADDQFKLSFECFEDSRGSERGGYVDGSRVEFVSELGPSSKGTMPAVVAPRVSTVRRLSLVPLHALAHVTEMVQMTGYG